MKVQTIREIKAGAISLGIIAFMALPVLAYVIPDTDQTNNTQSVAPTPSLTITDEVEPKKQIDSSGSYVDNNGTSDCTDDCSGHEAGYEWARDKDLCDPEYDGGNSESFAEGVRAYAYDNCYYEEDNEAF